MDLFNPPKDFNYKKMSKKLKVDKLDNPKIQVVWEDTPENFTQERIKRVRSYFQNKYNSKNVTVLTRAIDRNSGNELDIDLDQNVMDTTYQRNLMSQFVMANDMGVDIDLIKRLDDKINAKIDKLVLLDPTAPLRNKNDILEAINLFKRKKPDLLISANETKYNPYFNLLERCKKNKKFFKIVNKLKRKKEVGSTQAAPEVLHINCIVWIYSRKALFVEKKRIPKKTIVYKTSIQRSLDIDTKEDLNKLRYHL